MNSSFQYVCTFEECGKSFKAKKSLIEHMRIHNGEKPYECPHPGCGQRFTQFSSFQKHERIHTGEKPYKCKVCGRSFTQKDKDASILEHSGSSPNTHSETQEKAPEVRERYSCRICGKLYNQRAALKKHLGEHEDELINTVVEPASPKGSADTASLAKKLDSKASKTNVKNEEFESPRHILSESSRLLQSESSRVLQPEPSKLLFIDPSMAIKSHPMQLPPMKESSGVSEDAAASFPIGLQFYSQLPLAYLVRPELSDPNAGGAIQLAQLFNPHQLKESKSGNDLIGTLVIRPKLNLSKGMIKYKNEIYSLQNNMLVSTKQPNDPPRMIDNDGLNPSRCNNLPEISHYPDYKTLRSAYQEIVDKYKCLTMEMLSSEKNCNSFTCKCGPGRPGCNKCDCGVNKPDDETIDPEHWLIRDFDSDSTLIHSHNHASDECPLEENFCNSIKNKTKGNVNEHICLCKITRKFRHYHGPECGHVSIMHDGHLDYIVGGKLHHPHGDHCDDHGPICFIDTLSEDYAVGVISSGSLPECKV